MYEAKRRHPGKRLQTLLAGTALAVAVSVALPATTAQADTAAEIAALKKENAELRKMVEGLAQDLKIMQKTVNKTAEVATTPKTPPKMVSSGNENVSLAISGHANRMLLYADDGDQAQIFNADNKMSSTRLNVTGKGKIDDDLTAGAQIEVELQSNRSSSVTMRQETEVGGSLNIAERKAEVFLESKQFGKVWLGQGSVAIDGVMESDLSGTSVISSSSLGQDIGTSFVFRLAGTPTSSGRTVGNLFNNFDGGRLDRIRYDSPDFMGFVASASYADADINDYSLRFNRDFSGYKVAAAIGYDDSTTQVTGVETVGGSAAVKAPFGTSLQGTYAEQSSETVGRDDATLWYIKLGQEFPDLVPFGTTAFSIDYGETADQALNNSEGSWWNLAAVQTIKKAATEIYFNVAQYSADIPNTPTDDIFMAGLGARLKF